MNGIIINIDPVLVQIGHFALRWYSVAIITAVIAAVIIAAREAKRKGIAPDEIYNMLPWVLIAGLVGTRLFHVIDRWSYYSANPAQIFQIQQGGLAIWGGLVAGALAMAVYARARHLSVWRLADVLVPALLVAQIIGRVGCIVNGDAYGGLTSLPWAFIYTHPDAMIPPELANLPTHPYPIYEMLWNGASLALLLAVRRRLESRDGLLFFSYLALYAVGRFLLTFVRQENAWFLGLQEAQIISLAILAASVVMLAVMRRRTPAVPVQTGTG